MLTKSLHGRKIKSASTFHVGVLKMKNFESRLADMKSFVDSKLKAVSNGGGGKLLILFSIGTTHEKSVMEEMRNGVVSDKYESATEVLKLYGMKKFLSMAHGCRQPYILIHDLEVEGTLVERTGFCGGVLCAKV